jgi:hypothetical protein
MEAMTMATMTDPTYLLTVDEDLPGPIEVIAVEDSASIDKPVTIRPPAQDTAGQALDGWTVDVIVAADDTEGQAMTLRFPSAAGAAEFRRRLLITGALAGTIVAASAGASVLTAGGGAAGAASSGAAAYAHDADKVVTVSGPIGRIGNVTPELSRLADTTGIGPVGNVTPELSRLADTTGIGQEAAARAAQAKAIADATVPQADEPDGPTPGGNFRGR